MDPLAPPWLEKIANQGTGWVLFCLSLLVIWALIKHIRDLYKQSGSDAREFSAALTRSTQTIDENSTINREAVMANRELGIVVKELEKRIELVSQQARDRGEYEAEKAADRAASIERTIRDVLTGKA